MDIGLREWLIVIGLIVIAGILFDGWRRMRGGKGKLKFKLDRSFANLPDDDGDSAELLGPARVVEHREPSFDEQDLPSVSAREAKERKGGKRQEEPRQAIWTSTRAGPGGGPERCRRGRWSRARASRRAARRKSGRKPLRLLPNLPRSTRC